MQVNDEYAACKLCRQSHSLHRVTLLCQFSNESVSCRHSGLQSTSGHVFRDNSTRPIVWSLDETSPRHTNLCLLFKLMTLQSYTKCGVIVS